MPGDGLRDHQTELLAAAHAAASWARARRATWTDAPLHVPAPVSEQRVPAFEIAPEAPALPRPAPVPAPIAPAGPSAIARAAERVRELGVPVLRRLPRAAAIAALLAAGVWAGVEGGRYLLNARAASNARRAAAERVAAARPQPPRPVKTTGSVHVSSTPTGALVFIDGKPRGSTPLTVDDLSVGRHTVELRSSSGTVMRTVTIAADKTAEVDESIFSGWLAVYAPFELVVREGARTFRPDDRNMIMLPPGRHELRLVNQALGFEAVRQVDLKPGETARLTITPPPSTLTVSATAPSEVWLDGVRVGATPLTDLPAPLGTHEVVVRRADGVERRSTVTVTAKGATLHVSF